MEYNYPKVTAIAFRDFRSLADLSVDMTQSPIVALKGKSEVGKSSVSYGIRLLGANTGMRRHKEFIRDGASCWRILIKFEDGTTIIRTKTSTGQQFVMYKPDASGKLQAVWSVDKLDENDIPKEVQNYMGFCVEPETKEVLNVRLYKNLMLFVDTASSVNYKVMYNALKIGSISKAVQFGTKEANKINSDIGDYKTSIRTCQDQLRQIRIVNVEPLTKIRQALEGRLGSYEKVEGIRSRQLELQKIASLSHTAEQLRKLGAVDEGVITALSRAQTISNEVADIQGATVRLQEIKQLTLGNTEALQVCENISRKKEELAQVNTDKVELLSTVTEVTEKQEQLLSTFELVSAKKHEYLNVSQHIKPQVLDLTEVNEEKLTTLEKVKGLLKDILQADKVYQSAKAQADEYHKLLHESGMLVGTCPKCGETVVVQNE